MKIDWGLLVLRVSLGLMMMLGHGWGKVQKVLDGNFQFGDPIGLGPAASLVLAAFAEFLCSLLVVVGLATRWAAIPVVVVMLVAVVMVHGDDPFGDKELALVYAAGFLTLVFTGAGKYSLDARLRRRSRR